MVDYESTATKTSMKSSTHEDSKPMDMTLNKKMIKSLINLTTTRQNWCYVVGNVSGFKDFPKTSCSKASKRYFMYKENYNITFTYVCNDIFKWTGRT